MKKIAIIGYFGDGGIVSDGQGVKTKILSEELIKEIGKDQVELVNTHKWKSNPLKLIYKCISSFSQCSNIIFLTDENGIKVFPSFFAMLNLIFNKKIHYYVVGGWLSDYLSKARFNKYFIRKIDAIYVELPSMKTYMESENFHNVIYINKFRDLKPVSETDIQYYSNEPYRVCTFSRVLKEKGIEQAIRAVIDVNSKYGRNVFELDIFGKIDLDYEEDFCNLLKESPEYIKYSGVVDFNKSTQVLKEYFALLFPTYYKSEGYPNTFVDAYAAAVPLIASDFKYNGELIKDGIDGLIYDLKDSQALTNILEKISSDPNLINEMKRNCLVRSAEFSTEKAISILKSNLV